MRCARLVVMEPPSRDWNRERSSENIWRGPIRLRGKISTAPPVSSVRPDTNVGTVRLPRSRTFHQSGAASLRLKWAVRICLPAALAVLLWATVPPGCRPHPGASATAAGGGGAHGQGEVGGASRHRPAEGLHLRRAPARRAGQRARQGIGRSAAHLRGGAGAGPVAHLQASDCRRRTAARSGRVTDARRRASARPRERRAGGSRETPAQRARRLDRAGASVARSWRSSRTP